MGITPISEGFSYIIIADPTTWRPTMTQCCASWSSHNLETSQIDYNANKNCRQHNTRYDWSYFIKTRIKQDIGQVLALDYLSIY